MKDLEKGTLIRYIGSNADVVGLTHNQIYEVIEGKHYVPSWSEFDILISDDKGSEHYISEDFYYSYFIKCE